MEDDLHAGKIRDYRDLKVWKHGMELATDIYLITRGFPKSELFGLTSQMRRSSASIPANIAEGFGRQQRKSFVLFLRIAQGSLKELETHNELARRVGLMEEASSLRVAGSCEGIGKMLRALIRKLDVKDGGE
ncbi:four helix bundle protein [Aestuariivirga sp.]|uniref:four helix bundle protein n=1 Tax=Aestuariivirga sp. TaxID=2650926 RepID=UPI0035932C65